MEIETENAQILYLETQAEMLMNPSLKPAEHAAMRWSFAQTLALAGRMLSEHGSLLIHSHGRIAGLHSRLCRAVYGNRVKIVHSFHGVASFNSLKRWFTLLCESLLSPLTDALVCDSASELNAFGPLPIFCKITVISPFYDEANLVEHVTRPVRRIGFASRFDFPKLHEDLIRVVAAYNQRADKHLELVFCGDGPMRESVDKLGLSLLSSSYASLGHIEHIRDFYSQVDAYAHFSRYEGMPIGLVEAMASGLPSIATDVPGCRDAIRHGETGLLVKVGDMADGLGALELLTANDIAERLGKSAKEYARTAFSKVNFLSRHIELYRQIGYGLRSYEIEDV
jgi:glycosyltransferase involved in cell wall biosynthesis